KDDPPYDYSDFHDDDQDDEHYRPKELIGSTGRAPFWVKSDQIRDLTKQPILKTRGSIVRLKCLATGYPFPDIIWSKNDELMDTDRMSNKWILTLPHLKASDVGKYTCRVLNMFGSLNATFTVGMLDDKPEFEKTLLNTSISEGQTATFQCKVRSTIAPTIKWIKKIEAEHFVDDNKTFAYDDWFRRKLN
uniref:Ig-like domain-containing protein n=1 Tax=Romanomermis culicivorax TaxID=13658 RepID=A0A915KT28_ROMCU